MIRTGVPLVEVAGAAGFTDQSHLARHFTRVIGVTPGRYRQAVR
jgi:AraC-like DNA-binding protein